MYNRRRFLHLRLSLFAVGSAVEVIGYTAAVAHVDPGFKCSDRASTLERQVRGSVATLLMLVGATHAAKLRSENVVAVASDHDLRVLYLAAKIPARTLARALVA